MAIHLARVHRAQAPLFCRTPQPSCSNGRAFPDTDMQTLAFPHLHFPSITPTLSSAPPPSHSLTPRFPRCELSPFQQPHFGMPLLQATPPFPHDTLSGFGLLSTTGAGLGISMEHIDLGFGDGRNGSSRNGGRGRFTEWINNDPHEDADIRYQSLLQSDPQNSLLLQNYAEFLLHVKHDFNKAEECYERAILACPDDGRVLARYAELLWNVHRDSVRAGMYFERALEASPDDCYVAASYASFVWQSGEDHDDTKPILPQPHPSDVIRLMQGI